MIKSVKVENFFGIKKYDVDFTLGHQQQDDMNLEDQIIKDGNEALSLFPSFIGKNAVGKTSLIKSISFALRFFKEETFAKELSFYLRNIMIKKSLLRIGDTGELHLNGNFSKDIIRNLFKEISFAGSDFATVSLSLVGGREGKIELTSDSFFITMNNTTIDVAKLLFELDEKFAYDPNLSMRDNQKQIEHDVKKVMGNSKYEFYNLESESIFRADKGASSVGDIYLKNTTNKNIKNIISQFGFETFKLLLTKIDSQVSTVTLNLDNDSFEIYLNDIDIPISPSKLSFGTTKIIEIISKSTKLFKKGGIMMIDEIENGLHLSLIRLIVKLYSDPEVNIASAQLFVTTHNPSIFEEGIIFSHNIFVSDNNSIISLKQEKAKIKNSRTEHMTAMVKTKNYFNDTYWTSKNLEHKSSITNLKINMIINSISESGVWPKR